MAERMAFQRVGANATFARLVAWRMDFRQPVAFTRQPFPCCSDSRQRASLVVVPLLGPRAGGRTGGGGLYCTGDTLSSLEEGRRRGVVGGGGEGWYVCVAASCPPEDVEMQKLKVAAPFSEPGRDRRRGDVGTARCYVFLPTRV